MSDFVVSQLSNLTNNMNGGYPRGQSQYIKKLKLPNIYSIDASCAKELISFYDSKNIAGINSVVSRVIA